MTGHNHLQQAAEPSAEAEITRRQMLTGVAATLAVAATVVIADVAALPVATAGTDPADPVALVKYHATEVTRLMSQIHGRPWQLLYSAEMSFLTAIDIERFEAVSKAAYPPKRRRKAVQS